MPILSLHPDHEAKRIAERTREILRHAGVIVFAIITGDGTEEFNPSGERKLREDDTLLIVSHGTGRERLHELVEGLL